MAMKPARVTLVTPHYGLVSAQWAHTITNPTRGACTVVSRVTVGSSLLQKTFNDCLGIALRLRDEGVATHVAMAHSDIGAEPGWMDALLEEMRFHGADLVSAVIPIKNGSGHTSTAIGSRSDPWARPRYVTLGDREGMPPTFGVSDVAKSPDDVLLVNTGLWMADLRRPFWDRFAVADTASDPDARSGFQIHSRIVRTADGKYESQTRPEDWEMSRFLDSAGAKYMATWKVAVEHEGLARWSNAAQS